LAVSTSPVRIIFRRALTVPGESARIAPFVGPPPAADDRRRTWKKPSSRRDRRSPPASASGPGMRPTRRRRSRRPCRSSSPIITPAHRPTARSAARRPVRAADRSIVAERLGKVARDSNSARSAARPPSTRQGRRGLPPSSQQHTRAGPPGRSAGHNVGLDRARGPRTARCAHPERSRSSPACRRRNPRCPPDQHR